MKSRRNVIVGVGLALACANLGADRAAAQAVACFAPGTPPDVIAAHEQAMLDTGAPRYNLTGRWPGTIGTPIGLSWSLVPDGVSISPSPSNPTEPTANSELFARMDLLFGGRAVWIAQIEQAFERWSQLTGVGYYRVTSGTNDWDDGAAWGSTGQAGARGDIRIAMKAIDGPPVIGPSGECTSGCILAYNYYPQSGGIGGNMVLDRDEAWASGAPGFLLLRNTLMHEMGHGLGLLHVCPISHTKLMEPEITLLFDGPQHDDLRGVHHLYGDRAEENDSVNEVIDLGILTPGTPIEPGTVPAPAIANGSRISIDGDGDQDYFRFSIASSAVVTVTVTPLGLSYDSSPQCTSGNFVDSLTIANLNVQLIGSDGSSVIATAAGQQAGSVESIQNASLPTPGNYYVRVYEGNSPLETQLYKLSLSSGSPCTPPSPPTGVLASEPPDGVYYCDRVLVTWQQPPGATSYQVWRNTTNNTGSAEQIGTASTNSYEDFTVTPGAPPYWFWVKACNACGCSAFSAGDSGGASLPPAPPTGVFATSNFCDRIEVYWNSVPNATGYLVYRNTVNNPSTAQQVGSDTASPFPDLTPASGTLYFYWVKAATACGASGLSSPGASGQAGGIPAPSGVAAADGVTCGFHLDVSWNAVPGVTRYDIFSNSTNDPQTAILRNSTTGTSFQVTFLFTGWNWVWVRACDENTQCCSPLSTADRGFCRSPPVPEYVAASDGAYCDRVRVTWSNIPSTLAISYDVLRDSQVIATGRTSSPYDDFTASAGTSYSYAVRAGNSCNPISEATLSPPDTGYRTAVITAQPANATVCLGRSYQFCIAAAGPSLGYQWQFNGTNIAGAISPCYLATLAGGYRCVVSSSCGSVTTNSAMLTVISFNSADINADGSANGSDIQAFSTVLLSAQGGPPDGQRCAADMDGNGVVDSGDLTLFVAALLDA